MILFWILHNYYIFCEWVFYTVICNPKLDRSNVFPFLQIHASALLLFIVEYLEETYFSGF